jgi:hypothetical protein
MTKKQDSCVMPQSGGAYVRQKDGSLKRDEENSTRPYDAFEAGSHPPQTAPASQPLEGD